MFEVADLGPVPTRLVADTWHLYLLAGSFMLRLRTLSSTVLVTREMTRPAAFSFNAETLYDVIGAPPSEVGLTF